MSSSSTQISSKSCKACPCSVDIERVCNCGKRCKVLTSKTLKNPLRRYACCRNYNEDDGCQFFEWVDDSLCEITRSMVVQLMIKNEKLVAENERLGKLKTDENEEINKLGRELNQCKQELLKLNDKNQRLKLKMYGYKGRERIYIVVWLLIIICIATYIGAAKGRGKAPWIPLMEA